MILLILWNRPCSLDFAFCLIVWLIKLKCTSHPSHHKDRFWGSYVIVRSRKGGTLEPRITGGTYNGAESDLKGGTSDPSSYHGCYGIWLKNIRTTQRSFFPTLVNLYSVKLFNFFDIKISEITITVFCNYNLRYFQYQKS